MDEDEMEQMPIAKKNAGTKQSEAWWQNDQEHLKEPRGVVGNAVRNEDDRVLLRPRVSDWLSQHANTQEELISV